MRKIRWQILLISTFLFVSCICDAAPAPEQGTVFYVSPDGNDAWSGKSAVANKDKTDGPFATIGKARDGIRSIKAPGPLTRPVTVYIRGGLYILREPLTFTPEDSGTKESELCRT